METYKTGTVNTIINENGVDLGSINVICTQWITRHLLLISILRKRTLLMKIKNTSL